MSHMTTGYTHKITVTLQHITPLRYAKPSKISRNFKSLKNLYKHAIQTEKYVLS